MQDLKADKKKKKESIGSDRKTRSTQGGYIATTRNTEEKDRTIYTHRVIREDKELEKN